MTEPVVLVGCITGWAGLWARECIRTKVSCDGPDWSFTSSYVNKRYIYDKLLISHHAPERTDYDLNQVSAELPDGL